MPAKQKHLKIFFSGIGGSGVSAIAAFMAVRGHEVSGSDRAFDLDQTHPVAKFLRNQNMKIVPQDGSGIDRSLDFAVMSTAVEDGTPEVVQARLLGIELKTRPQYLVELASDFKTIAVAGTSGKSTASGCLAFLMKELGLAPNFIGGGRVKAFKTGGNPGNSIANANGKKNKKTSTGGPEWLVLEACESDGSIVNYKPLHSVILNLDVDHKGIEETALMFRALASNTKGKVFINSDDKNLRGLHLDKAVTFGMDSPADFMASDIRIGPFGSGFSVQGVDFTLSVPGAYNIYNALSAIAVLSVLGVPVKKIPGPLSGFTGIDRRFDIHLNAGGKLVIDDYAHNPHKIGSFMQAIKAVKDRVCYVFQPHGFGPVRMMKNEYIEAFAQNLRKEDQLVLLPIFYQGGTVCMDISSEDIARGVREAGKTAVAVSSRKDVLDMIDLWDCFVIMGARDESLSLFAASLAEKIKNSSR